MDQKITSGYYLDTNRFFKLDLFEDDTRAIVDYIHTSEDIDSGSLSKVEIFQLAVKVAKKRERYTPKVKKRSNKDDKKKLTGRNTQIKMHARAVYQGIVASENKKKSRHGIVSPVVASTSAAAASKSAAAASKSAVIAAAANTEFTEEDLEACFDFESSDEGVVALERY